MSKFLRIFIFFIILNIYIIILGYHSTVEIDGEPYIIMEEERMVLRKLKRFQKKESELFELFMKIRQTEGFEYYEYFRNFYKELRNLPTEEPKDKLEKHLYELFNAAYLDAERSVQRIYIYKQTGEPLALIYSNIYESKFKEKRASLLKDISKTQNLLKKHIKEKRKNGE